MGRTASRAGLLVAVLSLHGPAVSAAAPAEARRYARRAELGVEFSPGIAIPLKRYLDFRSGTDFYTMENGPGFGFGLSITLNHFELRWAYSRLSAGLVTAQLPNNLTAFLAQLGYTLPTNIARQMTEPLVFHNLTLGYRFTFAPTARLRLVVPAGLGLVIAEPPSAFIPPYNLFGFGLHAGFLVEHQLARLLSVGGSVRSAVYVTEPDPNLAGAGLAATQHVFQSGAAWLPLLELGVHARLHY